MNQLIDQAVEASTVKKVILHTRCGCTKIAEIAASELPGFIQVKLMIPDGWPEESRRFRYVGDSQVDGTPVYMEQAEPPAGFEVTDGKLVPVEDNSNERGDDVEHEEA